MVATPSIRRRRLAENRRKVLLRAAWVEEHGPCVQCGSSESLEIDHIDPKVKVTNHVWSWSAHRRVEELAKCQVLCVACHRKKSAAAYPPIPHGTRSRYQGGCRCDLCRQASSVDGRRYRAERKAKGLGRSCKLSPFRRLNEQAVKVIRFLAPRVGTARLARAHQMHKLTIRNVVRRKIWKHVA